MRDTELKIHDIMACNVYWDFEGVPIPKEQHKFLISFFPTETRAPDLIERIVAYGPDGYQKEISNQLFTNANTDGYIFDQKFNNYWYMLNLTSGYMPEGTYTIEVTCTNGAVLSKSRVQRDAPTKELVSSYLANRDAIRDSFSPARSVRLVEGTSFDGVRCEWSTLYELSGPDAYYIFRLSRGASPREFDTQNLTWWDNIFVQRMLKGETTAGLNRGGVEIQSTLEPGADYGYFVEVTDANVPGDTNICIFQPHQFFATP